MKGLFFVGFEAAHIGAMGEVHNGFLVAVVGTHEDAIYRKKWLSKNFSVYGKARIIAYIEGDEFASKSIRTLLMSAYPGLHLPGGLFIWNGEFDAYLHYAGYYAEKKRQDEIRPSAQSDLPIKIEAAKALRAFPPHELLDKSHVKARALADSLKDDLDRNYWAENLFSGAGGPSGSRGPNYDPFAFKNMEDE